jgi:hypothetical protein
VSPFNFILPKGKKKFKKLLFLFFLEREIDPQIFPYQAKTNADLLYMQKMHLISQNSKNNCLSGVKRFWIVTCWIVGALLLGCALLVPTPPTVVRG